MPTSRELTESTRWNRTMRVVMVGPFGLRPKGTVSARALPMAKALARRGHEVHLIVPPWDSPEDASLEWEREGVQLVNISLPQRLPFYWHGAIVWKLVRRALALQPQVIHCFKPKGYTGLAAMAFWELKRLGLIRAGLVVDSDDWEGKGGWNEIGGYSWGEKQLFAFQERWGLTHCDAVTVASRTLESLSWSLGVRPERTFYVPNGLWGMGWMGTVPPEAPPALAAEKEAGHPVVLFYSRFVETPLPRLVAILEAILQKVPEARILVVGKGLNGEEEELIAALARDGVEERLIYAGWAEGQELAGYLVAADVALFPYDDNLVNRAKCSAKLVDLMAAGLPIVADKVGENGEYLEHLASGYLVQNREPEAFAEAVAALLSDEGLRRRLGEGARQRIEEQYSWDRLVEKAEAAYRLAESYGTRRV